MQPQHQTTAAAGPAEPQFAALVAIDWADQKHFWSLRPYGGNIERGVLENSPEAVEAWVTQLHQRFGGQPIAVALEQRRGALQVLLGKYEQLYLYPVHPTTAAKYRQAWYPSGSKSDGQDADLLLEILTQHRDRLRRLDPDTTEIRLLQFQVENRRKLVEERTALAQKLQDTLKIYYPQIPAWFDNVTTQMVTDWLEKWPTLQDVQKARATTVEKFLRAHGVRQEEEVQKRLAGIRDGVAATPDRAVIESCKPMVAAWVAQLRILHDAIRQLEKAIRELAAAQEDWPIFDSLPGAGDALAPRLLAAMGSRRERFHSANELQCLAGIAPVTAASGQSQSVHLRRACPKFLRQTFHEWAACSIPRSTWAKACYDGLIARGKTHHVAVRALAFKWMRILYRCWRDRQPYDEQLYLASLGKRNLPLHRLAKAVQMP